MAFKLLQHPVAILQSISLCQHLQGFIHANEGFGFAQHGHDFTGAAGGYCRAGYCNTQCPHRQSELHFFGLGIVGNQFGYCFAVPVFQSFVHATQILQYTQCNFRIAFALFVVEQTCIVCRLFQQEGNFFMDL